MKLHLIQTLAENLAELTETLSINLGKQEASTPFNIARREILALTSEQKKAAKKSIDDILLDYLVNNSSDALIETVLDMYPDEVRERLR